jgi:hypothetical protein
MPPLVAQHRRLPIAVTVAAACSKATHYQNLIISLLPLTLLPSPLTHTMMVVIIMPCSLGSVITSVYSRAAVD